MTTTLGHRADLKLDLIATACLLKLRLRMLGTTRCRKFVTSVTKTAGSWKPPQNLGPGFFANPLVSGAGPQPLSGDAEGAHIDERENWIRKIVRYAQSSKQETRRITYY